MIHPPPPMFGFGIEFAYTIIIFIFCFIIYFKTKEIYNLTNHKGIQLFRTAFLLFGLSYVARFLTHMLMLTGRAFDIFMPFRGFFPFVLFIVTYLSTLAILYLIYGKLWKNIRKEHFLIFSNTLALSLSLLALMHRSQIIIIIFQTILLIFGIILIVYHQDPHKKFTQTNLLYMLLLVFWLLNLFVLEPRGFPFEIKITFYALSVLIFVIIYHKVHKWIK